LQASVDGKTAVGTGTTKKSAKYEAAKNLLAILEGRTNEVS
jgi:dsRNA-specific ribonuclease